MKALNLTGQPVGLNAAGNHGTSDISSKRLRVKIGDQDGTVDENNFSCSDLNANAENRGYNYSEIKKTHPHLSVLKDSIINLEDVNVILGQDC